MRQANPAHDSERPRVGIARLLKHFVLDFHNRTVLFRVGDWIFTTYGVLVAMAFGTGISVMLWWEAMSGSNPQTMARYFVFIVTLVGIRAFSVLLEWRELFRRPLQTLLKPGFMLHGGIAGGVAAAWVVSHLSGRSIGALLDGAAIALPLGEAVARLGCYVYGCCWGRPTGRNFGVRYRSPHAKVLRCKPHLEGVHIHPAQLYALIAYGVLFALMYVALPYIPYQGMLAGAYFIVHSVIRVSLERFREDDRGVAMGRFTHTNLYSLLMVLGGGVLLLMSWQAARPLHLNLSVRLVHVLTSPSLLPWILVCSAVFGLAYGLHRGSVGSWIRNKPGHNHP